MGRKEKSTMLRNFLKTNNDVALTILRLVLGIVFFAHGAQKVFGWFGGYGFAATLQFMGGLGIPKLIAVLAVAMEFGGSILLILGALTRLGALGIIGIMVGAMATVHLKVGFFMNWNGNQKGEGFEYHLLALAIAVALLIRGGGAYSVDGALTQTRTGMRKA
jgi:putative oxidoreductase